MTLHRIPVVVWYTIQGPIAFLTAPVLRREPTKRELNFFTACFVAGLVMGAALGVWIVARYWDEAFLFFFETFSNIMR